MVRLVKVCFIEMCCFSKAHHPHHGCFSSATHGSQLTGTGMNIRVPLLPWRTQFPLVGLARHQLNLLGNARFRAALCQQNERHNVILRTRTDTTLRQQNYAHVSKKCSCQQKHAHISKNCTCHQNHVSNKHGSHTHSLEGIANVDAISHVIRDLVHTTPIR